MANKAIRGVLCVGLALALVRCGDDAKKVTTAGNDGGAGQAGEAPTSGGSDDVAESAGAPTSMGGMPGGAGEPSIEAGSGGAPNSSGGGVPSASGAPGAAGELGMAGAGNECTPTDCCSVDQPSCAVGWDTECSGTGAYNSCCDPATGISKDCGYAGGGIEREANICLDSCTSKSFGTSACGACTNDQDPGCDTDWAAECSSGQVFCSDLAAGYRMSCIEEGYNRTVAVECVCDPDVPVSGRLR